MHFRPSLRELPAHSPLVDLRDFNCFKYGLGTQTQLTNSAEIPR
jgi:hypothetical protein